MAQQPRFADIPRQRVNWAKTHRLILSHFPPIDLFDDVADPHDWEELVAAEAMTNPRIYEEVGNLALVPKERRLNGKGASWVMAAFTHISPDRKTRFSDGSFGVYYAGNSLKTVFYEHAFHMARFYKATGVKVGWACEVRELVGSVDTVLRDLRSALTGAECLALLDKTDYTAAQQAGASWKGAGENGVVYPSQRHEGGDCIAIFFPDAVTPPHQGDHFSYHWNGQTIDYIKKISSTGTQEIIEIFL